MILLTVTEIIDLHETLVRKTGGSVELRDIGLLESAVYGAMQSFDDEEVYKSIEEKAARFAFALVKNHAFIDGNKRIGIFVMLMTLRLNGVQIRYTQDELIDLGLGIADGRWDYDYILSWINANRI